MSRVLHSFQTQETLIDALSQSILKNLQEAIEERGKASLIVSGGSTPKPLFQKLSTLSFAWEKVSVGLCDERWIPAWDEESNEHLVKTYLLQDKASAATFVGMYEEGCEAGEAEILCSQKIKESLFPFDVLVLGMGVDAHTASLFPYNVKLGQAFDLESEALCIAIEPTTAPYMRLSLTRKALLSAQHIYLHFEGKEKQAVYAEVIAGDDCYAMPVRTVLNQNDKQIEVYYR
ncbi:MAG TPA: 6-phosphogluconolactonase [Sulfurovum sp.]|jgi:6-phosphogluconolactonase|nr:MAG: 6-phosphogluconolactonase [Sulfurovum sp. 35-42-20]OYY55819.1 MAG: 6-phosphogluconolactonase [Sulfurovum sp. 28-43-6]OYZ25666.1 MAG: 6-phosphogluconolactonase [Sulfurovum sp. 16-42-52]OYZ50209.1 MAG: 6-phosphogluconolactonase [Sulfurovum sp. 24-42-9]OZA45783.1 MAG: 6-phosphogluconolactonase [Sulfurovum sp. 17-42-90]OZA60255.1 MAG: 6-phosphogluconolactonase [Sulfurovum sp. 39-42-12]HQR73290.1 6-phosphogluconolactonase [Sulfurovum sp.]